MKKDTPLLRITELDGRSYDHLISDKDVTIGRGDDNVLTFIDPKVSRKHAKISKKGKSYVLADLGSFNGTRLNAEFVTCVTLKNGDEIRIGGAVMIFQSEKERGPFTDDKLEFAKDDEYEQWQHRTIAIKPQDCTKIDSQTLLIAPKSKRKKERSIPILSRKEKPTEKDQAEISRT
jgi:hypothetical protein